jgi:hypothetical protein
MTERIGVVLLGALVAGAARAADDGSQLLSPFRINYLAYFQHGPKIASTSPLRAATRPGR